jgi:hypothetical protein
LGEAGSAPATDLSDIISAAALAPLRCPPDRKFSAFRKKPTVRTTERNSANSLQNTTKEYDLAYGQLMAKCSLRHE